LCYVLAECIAEKQTQAGHLDQGVPSTFYTW
jgi:hypothetical protein